MRKCIHLKPALRQADGRYTQAMMKTTIVILSLFFQNICLSQTNELLSKQIDSMKEIDQYWRGMIRRIDNKETDSVTREFANKKIQETDSLNFIKVNKLFDKFGFPGFKEVGKQSSHNFWLLVQHFDKEPNFQEKVLKKMKVEVDSNNTSKSNYAYLVDRVKVNTGQLQIYGTQMVLNKDSTSYEPKPLFEPEKVNERRQSILLPPIENYIEMMNKRYFGTLKQK
jgi:hypothetical protein